MNIESLLQHIHPLLKKAIADLSAEITEVFGELANEAEDADARGKVEECLNSFKRQAAQMDKAMMARFQEQLTELGGETLDQVAKEYAVDVTADDLSLIEEADLEQQVSLESMASKMLNNVIGELNLLNQRLNEGYKRTDIDDKTNPLGPVMFAETFGIACGKIQATIEQRLLIFKTFERTAFQSLKTILVNANANLKGQGILPNAELVHKPMGGAGGGGGGGGGAGGLSVEGAEEGGSGGGGNAGGGNAGGGNAGGGNAGGGNAGGGNAGGGNAGGGTAAGAIPMATQMHTPSGMFDIADPVVKEISELVAKDGVGVLQKLMTESSGGSETRISSAGVGDQNFSEKKQVEDDELLDILNTLQHQAREDDGIPVLEGEFQRTSVTQGIGSALQVKSKEEGAETALSKDGNDVVNLVDMLFDFILSDDYLSDSVKQIISELQVPLTKVALLDKTFFSDKQHPARQLLNELSHTGMSVEKDANVLEDKTYQNITNTVTQVKENFEDEATVFTEVLEDFTTSTQKQTKRTHVLEQRLMDAEKGRAKSEHAEEMVQELYAQLRAHVPVPKEVNEFLDTAWRDVLLMTCLKFGSHSKQWKADASVTKKLMKSVLMAKKARLDKKRMKIPMDLLKLLKKALDRISYDPLESKRLLSILAKCYQAIAATSPEDVREELIHFGGDTAAAVRVVATKAPEVIDDDLASTVAVQDDQVNKSESGKAKGAEQTEDGTDARPVTKKKGLTKEQIIKKAEKMKALKAEIEKEKEAIASSPVQALEEKMKGLDEENFEAKPDLDIEEGADEFVEGDTWFDMASSLPVGTWVEIEQESTHTTLRCKLVANIRTLQKLIFVNKAGAKVAERKIIELASELKEKKAKVVNDNTIFDQALENVIVNLRTKEEE